MEAYLDRIYLGCKIFLNLESGLGKHFSFCHPNNTLKHAWSRKMDLLLNSTNLQKWGKNIDANFVILKTKKIFLSVYDMIVKNEGWGIEKISRKIFADQHFRK